MASTKKIPNTHHVPQLANLRAFLYKAQQEIH